MLRKLRSRITYANVVATLALFVAVGTGGAYAANTVFSSDIVNGEVKSVDIGDNEINSADVKDQTLNTFDVHTFLGVDVVDNTLTGADVDESTLNLAAEPWHEVGTAGEPPFDNGFCVWSNADAGSHNTAAFLRDRFGFVHLKGYVRATGACDQNVGLDPFVLPNGYRTAKQEVHPTLTNNVPWRINVNPTGNVEIEPATPDMWNNNFSQWISLDGISFRCAPSGQNGCP
jgi:hypothetical protein